MLTPFQTRERRVLSRTPVFKILSKARMRSVSRKSVRKGETLFEKGDASDSLYALISGQLKLFSPSGEGRRISFGLVVPGELVGAMDILNGARRHASASALAHSELASLDRLDLERLMLRNPTLRSELSQAASDDARRLGERIEDAAFLSIEDRVEKVLADCALRFGERIEGGTRIRLRQQDLADILGLSRESVNKVLTAQAVRGRLALGRGRIDLLRMRNSIQAQTQIGEPT